MNLYTLDPLQDPRWSDMLGRHPLASVFHSPGWLTALRQTYGYTPIVFTSSPLGAELTNGIVFCLVESRLTGRRLVSLPFSDHCEPLVGSLEELNSLLAALSPILLNRKLRYAEIRPLQWTIGAGAGFQASETFTFHRIPLDRPLPAIFAAFHRTSVQQRIRHAERASLEYEVGASPSLLHRFYHLFLMTRRRHGLPPPPFKWLRILAHCLGEDLHIHLVSKDGQAVAGILTLRNKTRLVCKYACSDDAFKPLSGLHLAHWRALEEAARVGIEEYDLGRSDCSDTGLITFKNRWGAVSSSMSYWRWGAGPTLPLQHSTHKTLFTKAIASMPDRILAAFGALLYRHVG